MPVDKSPSVRNVTGEELIEELLSNLEQSLEPLRYTVYAPSVFDIYLHPADLDRLTGILPQIAEEARQALEEHLQKLQRGPQATGLRRILSAKKTDTREYKNVAGGWFISFFENTDPEAKSGDILIDSRLTLPKGPDLEGANKTRRISTLRSEGVHRVVESKVIDKDQARHVAINQGGRPAPPRRDFEPEFPETGASALPPRSSLAGNSTRPMPPASGRADFSPHVTTERRPVREESGQATVKSAAPGPFPAPPSSGAQSPVQVPAPTIARARLTFTDQGGARSVEIGRPEVTIGRGGTGHWVDVKVEASSDVSRTHLKIRRDERGRFFIRDLSAFGTTVDGHRLTSSLEQEGDRKIDRMREELLPPRAKIGLADVVFMEFEVLPS